MSKNIEIFNMSEMTHELNTPLTILNIILENLEDKYGDNVDLKKGFKEIENIDQILRLHNLDFKLNKIINNKEKVNLSQLTKDCTGKYGKNVFNKIKKNIYIYSNKELIIFLIEELLSNASKHSTKNGKITVRLKEEGLKLILEVGDEGIGINQDEKESIFLKYYKSPRAKRIMARGSGIGLKILKDFCDMMNWEVKILKNKPGGTIFKILIDKININ